MKTQQAKFTSEFIIKSSKICLLSRTDKHQSLKIIFNWVKDNQISTREFEELIKIYNNPFFDNCEYVDYLECSGYPKGSIESKFWNDCHLYDEETIKNLTFNSLNKTEIKKIYDNYILHERHSNERWNEHFYS